MYQIRCSKCNKLLCRAEYADIEIKCNKCKSLVRVKLDTQSSNIFQSLENYKKAKGC